MENSFLNVCSGVTVQLKSEQVTLFQFILECDGSIVLRHSHYNIFTASEAPAGSFCTMPHYESSLACL